MFRLTLTLSLAGLAACASGGSGNAAATDDRASRPASRSANLITAEELEASTAQNLFRAIEMLRPTWLRVRGTASVSTPGAAAALQVYLDNSHYGVVTALQQLTVTSVREVRYLDGREATTRFGTGHGAGAILVRLK